MIISQDELDSFLNAHNACPHNMLGMHNVVKNNTNAGVVVRTYLCDAKECNVIDLDSGNKFSLYKIDKSGFFERFFPGKNAFNYKLQKITYDEQSVELWDPYSFDPFITDYDRSLFAIGKNYEIYKKLGANPQVCNKIKGYLFGVWAPNARAVSVVGDFNQWDGRYHQMRLLGNSGIWEIFIPEIQELTNYKFQILNARGNITLKSDPYAVHFEGAPNNSSKIFDINHYCWHDHEWILKRSNFVPQKETISIYELHLDSWRRVPEENNRPLTYRELADELVQYLLKLGFSHVELLPPTEHPFLGSWGYQVTGFFAPTHRYGTPSDFMYFVDKLHQNNIGVIIDWVPAHFPKDAFALEDFDGTKLYEHEDPKIGYHAEWGTLIFNYGRNEVRNFLISSAYSWAERFHIDGIRVDAVSSMLYRDYSRKEGQWIPNKYGGKENIEAIEFLRELNEVLHDSFKGFITIAEESTSFGGITRAVKDNGMGFDFKWNMGWMHDVLFYISKDPIYRKFHHNQLTFGMLYQYSENFICALSHDEVVHGKSSLAYKIPGISVHDKLRELCSLYAYMWFWPGKKTLFMGSEFGQTSEWNYSESLDWHLLKYEDHVGVQNLICDLNNFYREFKFLGENDSYPCGFEWICCNDCDNSVVSFVRLGNKDKEKCIVVCNFTPVDRINYRIGSPLPGKWKEVLNTDSNFYGGSNRGNCGSVIAENIPFHHRPWSIDLYLPSTSVLVLMPE